MRIWWPLLILVLVLAALTPLLSPPAASAQETVVQGVVTDEEGKPVKDARLTFSDPTRGLNFVSKQTKNGKFIKVGIPPATYKITVEFEGFLTLESEARIRFGMRETLISSSKSRSRCPTKTKTWPPDPTFSEREIRRSRRKIPQGHRTLPGAV